MLKDQQKFDQLGQKLFMAGVLQDFEKKHGSIKGRMMVTEGKIPPEMLVKLQADLMKNPNWKVVEGSFDFSNYTIGMVVSLNPVKTLTQGWLVPQLGHPGPEPDAHWQEFFIKKVLDVINEKGSLELPIYTWISDKSDLTKTDDDQ